MLFLRLIFAFAVAFAVFPTMAASVHADEFIEVEFVRVYDGDTVDVRLPSLPRPLDKLRIRLAGIDTPELGKRARCPLENDLARKAQAFLADELKGSEQIRVYGFKWDKYGGRLLGDLRTSEGSIKDLLISSGHAVPYKGVGLRQDWCPKVKI